MADFTVGNNLDQEVLVDLTITWEDVPLQGHSSDAVSAWPVDRVHLSIMEADDD